MISGLSQFYPLRTKLALHGCLGIQEQMTMKKLVFQHSRQRSTLSVWAQRVTFDLCTNCGSTLPQKCDDDLDSFFLIASHLIIESCSERQHQEPSSDQGSSGMRKNISKRMILLNIVSMIGHYRLKNFHTSPQTVLAAIRQRFQPVQGKGICEIGHQYNRTWS